MRLLEIAGSVWQGAPAVGALGLGLGIFLVTTDTHAAEEGSALDALWVEVIGHALSLEVGDAALREVLREVARQAGFEVETWGELGRVQRQRFEGVPLDEGIRRLIGKNRVNLIMRYELDETGERRLVEVTARATGEVPAELLEERRMRVELSRIRVPPPPPPPPMQ